MAVFNPSLRAFSMGDCDGATALLRMTVVWKRLVDSLDELPNLGIVVRSDVKAIKVISGKGKDAKMQNSNFTKKFEFQVLRCCSS